MVTRRNYVGISQRKNIASSDPANTQHNQQLIITSKHSFDVIIACLLRCVFAEEAFHISLLSFYFHMAATSLTSASGGVEYNTANFAESRWRHQMERFSALLALYAGYSPVTGEFPAQRLVTRSFDVFFDLRLNKRFSKQSWGWWFETPSRSLWRHCNDIPRWLHVSGWDPNNVIPIRAPCKIKTKLGWLTCVSHDNGNLRINIEKYRYNTD